MTEDQRHLHHQLVRARGAEVVAHPPHPVLPAHPALVRGVDHEGVAAQPEPLQPGEHLAHAIVDPADLGRRALHRVLAVVEGLVRVLPRVHRVDREALELPAAVVRRVAVARRVVHQPAEDVGPVVGEEEEERPLPVPLDEAQGAVRPEVRRVTGLPPHFAVLDHVLVVELARVPVGLGHPVIEALGGGEVGAEVPLAAEAAGVAGVAEDLPEGGELAQRVVRLRSHHIARVEERVHAVLRGEEPGQQGRARGRAHGVAGEGAGEANAFAGEAVDVRRADVWVAVAAEGPRPLVVGQNQDEVGRAGGARRGGGEERREQQRHKERAGGAGEGHVPE